MRLKAHLGLDKFEKYILLYVFQALKVLICLSTNFVFLFEELTSSFVWHSCPMVKDLLKIENYAIKVQPSQMSEKLVSFVCYASNLLFVY